MRRAPEVLMRSVNHVWCIYAWESSPAACWRHFVHGILGEQNTGLAELE